MTTAHGYHVPATNDQPTTDEVRGYVFEQVICRDTYANLTAISSPPTGLHGWCTDTKTLIVFNGVAWVPANIPVFTTATRPSSRPTNTVVFDSDVGSLIRWDGSAWSPVGVVVCTSSTRPGTPVDGQIIVETDTDRVYVRQGSNWCPVPGAHVAVAASPPNAADGVMHYMSDRRRLLVRNNSAWETVGPFICTSGTRPTNPAEGDLLWETDTNMAVVHDGSNWVYVPAAYVSASAPTNKLAGALHWDTGASAMNVWDGSAWKTVGVAHSLAFSTGDSAYGSGGTTTQYIGTCAFSTVEGRMQWPIAQAATLTALYVNLSTAPGGTDGWSFTVRKNGSDTALTCSVTGANTTGNDTSHSVSVAAGDLLDIKWAVTSGPPNTPNATRVHVAVKAIA